MLIVNIFVSTGVSKIFNFGPFIRAIKVMLNVSNNYIVYFLAISVITTEIGFSLLLLIGRNTAIPSIALISLLFIFNLMIVMHIRKKSEISCQCGGFLGNHILNKGIVARNFVLIASLFLTLIFPPSTNLLTLLDDIHQLVFFVYMEALSLIILFFYRYINHAAYILKNIKTG
ncbi:hypothetical protein AZ66_21185 [Paenibacillus sp. E194]|nr:hypothetical protein AZ66_21185 [Paenibacillus sp. E194]